MKKQTLLVMALISLTKLSLGQINSKSTYVNGYFKSNGTYINGYYRTAPNSTINDNFSTYPNFNPFTGVQGTIQPTYVYPYYSTPSYSSPYYDYSYYYLNYLFR